MKEPKIRFKGFSGEWKDLPFSEIVERTSSTGKTGSLPGIEFEDIVSGEGCLNKDVYQKDCRKYGKIFREGDILFGKLRPYLKNILLAEFRGIAIGDFWILRPGDNDSKFIYNLVNSEAFMRVANVSSGSKMPRADWNLVSSTCFLLPQDKVEQEAIGKYFTSLDAQISASTSRLASLKQMKAASLQAMFPQEGETVPKVRFKGFDGEWKKVKLGEIGSWSKGKLLSKDNISETGKFKCIHYGELFTMYDEIIYQVFSKTDLNNGCLSQIGDILFPDSDVTPTGLARCSSIMETGVILGGGILILRPLPQYYSPFISLSVNNEKQQIISRITGTTVRHINATSLSEIEIVCTENIAEQQSIASFFTSLDRQITLHAQRLEKLKQIKAACLDKMFV